MRVKINAKGNSKLLLAMLVFGVLFAIAIPILVVHSSVRNFVIRNTYAYVESTVIDYGELKSNVVHDKNHSTGMTDYEVHYRQDYTVEYTYEGKTYTYEFKDMPVDYSTYVGNIECIWVNPEDPTEVVHPDSLIPAYLFLFMEFIVVIFIIIAGFTYKHSKRK